MDILICPLLRMLKRLKVLIKKIIRKVLNILKSHFIFNKKRNYKKIKKMIDFSKYSKIIVFENSFGWNGIMKQRPQQIAEHMPESVLFLYHSSSDKYDNFKSIRKIKSNLYIINMDLYRKYFVKEKGNLYLMIYSTNFVNESIINEYYSNDFDIIYEYVDDINVDLTGKEAYDILVNQHKYIMSLDRVYVVCTATKLYDNITKKQKKLITNGCDYDHFKLKKRSIPDDMKSIIKKGYPIIGYYGALASWFDYNLIKQLAMKNYSIVLVGLDYDNTLNKSGILKLDNVYYLGKKDYEVLPDYLNFFDVATIPFVINEITLSTSPVKVFEYMASLKPIVTTKLPECTKYKSVFTSSNYEEFMSNIEKGLRLKNDSKYINLLKDESLENTWNSKCLELIDFISEVKDER